MKIEIVPYEPRHLEGFILAPLVAEFQPLIEAESYRKTLVSHLSATALVDGKPVGCAGLQPHSASRARAWALPGRDMPIRAWPLVTRAALILFSEAHKAGFRRLELVTRASSDSACRWAGRLGFSNPKTMDCYFDDGGDAILWRRLAT